MVFGKAELLPEDEWEREWLLDEVAHFWNKGLSVNKIAEQLGFGDHAERNNKNGVVGYPNIKPRHIYYFVQQYGKEYGMKPRRKLKQPKDNPETKIVYGVPRQRDMPEEVIRYLMVKGWLIE